MNHGYSRYYTPGLKNSCLFHQYTTRSAPTYYPAQRPAAPPAINANLPAPSLYARQSPYIVPSNLPYSPQSYPYYPTSSRFPSPAPLQFSPYSVPAYSYPPTVSSKGLVIVLIATLVLVALDLVIVRPLKARSAIL
ncbi:hypothetical protein [Desulfosporosinus youngiae]|uniref:hypothetical protein n=1 Tax=Desulfosporosinus youngiae TaxID=339862 RepID=UPI0012F47F13|nr:hypothetical protein [Desulfosporosinus youngiae]